MCGLCGIVGNAPHWSEGVPAPSLPDTPARRRERQERVRGLNRVLSPFGLTAADWQAHAYVIATRTGRSEIVDNTAHLWPAAARLCGKPCDPLDPKLIARLEAEVRR
ncbi:hypothetical protein ACELLULO517_13660 [Acidisoma cellulosilytica]|uniref:Uncharacterized protein n=1 Tax=Acidisoma cellulosilyticum TaxID=2802395 RepID=A0A963Z2F1_9PROT|nr:hypothetical protein [Acidisoma cellulosilyticum]MCB8881289.1 hypothetical protein [Acidisoma cellulosilyticum]